MTDEHYLKWEALREIWDSILPFESKYYADNFDNIAPKLLRFLITSLRDSENFEIGTYGENGAIVTFDQYDNFDKQLNLIMFGDKHLELELYLYDDSDEEDKNPEKRIIYRLSEEKIKFVPPALLAFMAEVKKKKKPMKQIGSALKSHE
ncbi:MAG: hypothetical protein ABL940_10670 [Bacteroidia bacterium]